MNSYNDPSLWYTSEIVNRGAFHHHQTNSARDILERLYFRQVIPDNPTDSIGSVPLPTTCRILILQISFDDMKRTRPRNLKMKREQCDITGLYNSP